MLGPFGQGDAVGSIAARLGGFEVVEQHPRHGRIGAAGMLHFAGVQGQPQAFLDIGSAGRVAGTPARRALVVECVRQHSGIACAVSQRYGALRRLDRLGRVVGQHGQLRLVAVRHGQSRWSPAPSHTAVASSAVATADGRSPLL